MKTAVVFYSLEGNTKYVAEQIAKNLNADLIQIIPEKEYEGGTFKKYFFGGKSVLMGEKPVLKPYLYNHEDYDRVIIGFPIWAASFASPIKTFLTEHNFTGKKIAAFSCSKGGSALKAFENIKRVTGCNFLDATLCLKEPKQEVSTETKERIEEFCKKLNALV